MTEIENMYNEDFHELYYQAYLQISTESGKKELEDETLKDEMEELEDSMKGYGPMDQGLAIQQAIMKNRKR